MRMLRLAIWATATLSAIFAVMVVALGQDHGSLVVMLVTVGVTLVAAPVFGKWVFAADAGRLKWTIAAAVAGAFTGVWLASWVGRGDGQGVLLALITVPAGVLAGCAIGLSWPRRWPGSH